jgi:hypothetical protein
MAFRFTPDLLHPLMLARSFAGRVQSITVAFAHIRFRYYPKGPSRPLLRGQQRAGLSAL